MSSWTTPDDVLNAWIGDDKPEDESLVQSWIDKAERLIRFKVAGISDRLDSGNEPDLLETIKDVVSAMVERRLRNPDGIRQMNTTAGPYTESRTLGGDNPGMLYLEDSELAQLTAGLTGRPRAFSIDLLGSAS